MGGREAELQGCRGFEKRTWGQDPPRPAVPSGLQAHAQTPPRGHPLPSSPQMKPGELGLPAREVQPVKVKARGFPGPGVPISGWVPLPGLLELMGGEGEGARRQEREVGPEGSDRGLFPTRTWGEAELGGRVTPRLSVLPSAPHPSCCPAELPQPSTQTQGISCLPGDTRGHQGRMGSLGRVLPGGQRLPPHLSWARAAAAVSLR